MVTRAKIAVSLDPAVLARAERLRRATGESRSALVNRALAALVEREVHETRVAQYVDAYRLQPETAQDVAAARALARGALGNLEWDE